MQDLPHCASAVPSSICHAIKVTVMAVQKIAHPLKLPFLRHLSRRAHLPHPPSSNTERFSMLTDRDKEIRISAVTSSFINLCPKLTKQGVGHAGDVLEVLDVVSINSTGRGDRGGIHESKVYFYFSFANHSCDGGNATYFNKAKEYGNRLLLVSENDIQAGEELLISYMRKGMHYSIRRGLLKETYGFDCHCCLCTAEKPSA